MRARILGAARELFFEKGFQATTVVELAERADVAKKTLFNHFEGKQDVLRALAAEVFDRLLADVEAARKTDAPTRDQLAAFFGRIRRLHTREGPGAREMAGELLRATQEAGLQPGESHRFHDALEGLVRDGVARGDVTTRHSIATLADGVSAVYFQLIVGWSQDEKFPLTRKAREAAAFLADAIERRPDE